MVYETDFYTVRRTRPTITSYSVTAPRLGVSTWNVKPSIRTSVLLGELDRIYHKPRPQLGHIALEDYLNSRPLVDFDDETRLIRAETDRLRRRIHLAIPHPRHSSPLHVFPYCGNLEKTPERPHHPMVDDILYMSYYSEPTARTIGRGHLACVTFAGGKGYPRRRNYYSDENRDIGEEIKTRSYYHNNYNKNSYVDAMSLPTGYASFLLRLKPPESNETLTNLDKMHILALAEERKRNIKKNKTDGNLIDSIPQSKWTKDISPIKDSSKVLKKQLSKPMDEETFVSKNIEQPKKETPVEEVKENVCKLDRQKSLPNEDPVEEPPVKSIEETPVKEEPEIVKPEKKSKLKKSSLSRNSSIQESPKPSVDEIPKAEEKPAAEEPPKLEEEPKVEETTTIETVSTTEKETPTAIEVTPEEPAPTTDAEKLPEEPIPEPEPTPSTNEQKEPEPSVIPVTSEVVESTPDLAETGPSEPEPVSKTVEQKEEVQPVVETEKLAEPSAEPIPAENAESEPAEPASQEVVQKDEVIETEAPSVPSEPEKPAKTDEIVTSETTEPVPAEETPKEEVAAEAEKTSEVVSTEVVASEITQEPATTVSSQEETVVTKFQTTKTTVITSTTITASSEMNVSENIIEEVSHSNESTVQKDEPEPLIEEPQSPEIITNNINTTEICEVLSDVPEES